MNGLNNRILLLPAYDPIPLNQLLLPIDILFRPFLYNDLQIPSARHAEAIEAVERALIHIIGRVACRNLINWTIRHYLMLLAPHRPANGVYCGVEGASFRGIGFCYGQNNSSTTDVGYYYQKVSFHVDLIVT